jgi:predicted Zn-dependent protease
VDDQDHFAEAISLKEKQQYAQAQQALEQLALRQPKSAALRAVLGDVYWKQGMLDKAIEAFRVATVLSPRSETASLGLFHCLWQSGQQAAAIAEAKRLLRLRDCEDYRNILSELGLTED